MEAVSARFLRYVGLDTESKHDTETVPSTPGQFVLGALLKKELEEMGFRAETDEHGYVYGFIPGNNGKQAPVLGLIAHMDTSPDISGANVKPRIVKNYDGGDIRLNEQHTLSPNEFEVMRHYVGQDLIVTDGTTLLGADDKAGVAEIMALCEFLSEHPEYPHGELRIGFTPDEEVGNGPSFFDLKKFGANFAYTVDGGELGELEYENFNGASLKVVVTGKNIHPGSAKNKMMNAQHIAMEFHGMLPPCEVPEHTENYEGFFHLTDSSGSVEHAELHYIIRDHDWTCYEKRKATALKICAYLNEKYGENIVSVTVTDSYRNMKEQILPHPFLIENAKVAMEQAGVTPKIIPIRGGTDGARLSFMGLPCPNLCTGGHNFHGRFEYIPIQSMESCVEILKKLVAVYGE